MGLQALTAALAPHDPRPYPPGARRDDLLLCFPVVRTNQAHDRAAADHLREVRPDVYASADFGRPHAMTRLAIVRAGSVIAEAMSDATECR